MGENARYEVQDKKMQDLKMLDTKVQCESKKVAPLKLFAIFSLVMNLCN